MAEKSAADRSEQQERAVSGKIEAKVYLRYSNEVPSAINNAFAMGEFGLQEMTSHISQ